MDHRNMPRKNRFCLWFENNANEAAPFYAAPFPDSKVTAIRKAPGDYPGGKAGDELIVEFTVVGIPCIGINGGPTFKQSEAFSFQIATANQEETDPYWNAIVGNGGQESPCGWCKDRGGVGGRLGHVDRRGRGSERGPPRLHQGMGGGGFPQGKQKKPTAFGPRGGGACPPPPPGSAGTCRATMSIALPGPVAAYFAA